MPPKKSPLDDCSPDLLPVHVFREGTFRIANVVAPCPPLLELDESIILAAFFCLRFLRSKSRTKASLVEVGVVVRQQEFPTQQDPMSKF